MSSGNSSHISPLSTNFDLFSLFSVPFHNSLSTERCYRLCRSAKHNTGSSQISPVNEHLYTPLQHFANLWQKDKCSVYVSGSAQLVLRAGSSTDAAPNIDNMAKWKSRQKFHSFSKNQPRPLSNTFSSSTANSKPAASAEGLQLTSFCHKPSSDLSDTSHSSGISLGQMLSPAAATSRSCRAHTEENKTNGT